MAGKTLQKTFVPEYMFARIQVYVLLTNPDIDFIARLVI